MSRIASLIVFTLIVLTSYSSRACVELSHSDVSIGATVEKCKGRSFQVVGFTETKMLLWIEWTSKQEIESAPKNKGVKFYRSRFLGEVLYEEFARNASPYVEQESSHHKGVKKSQRSDVEGSFVAPKGIILADTSVSNKNIRKY